jgi:hypothetical protein
MKCPHCNEEIKYLALKVTKQVMEKKNAKENRRNRN